MSSAKTNQLEKTDSRDTVQVFCRLRPLQDECELPSIKLLSKTTLATSTEFKSKSVRKDCNYVFRHVFTSYTSQQEVFEHVAVPLLEDLVNGRNGLLFTYGVTGSGKTFTLTGDAMAPGIMPLCIHTLFNSIEDKQAQKYLIKSDRMNGFELQSETEAVEERIQETKMKNKRLKTNKKTSNSDKIIYANEGNKLTTVNPNSLYSVFISYTEIYNNVVYDLLEESNKVLLTKIIREDSQKNMYVNCIEEEVKSASEAFELFHVGQKKKRMAHTQLNAESSRSHSIFNIRIAQLVKNMQGTEIPSQSYIKIGQLSLVDLAGSERCNRTNNTGIRLKEAGSINNSLMTLRSCMEILRENQHSSGTNKVVPYRESRLTLLFKNYFHGEGQVRMVVCINPSEQDYEENLQVLKFAEITQEVQVTKIEPRYLQQFKTPNKRTQTPKTVRAKDTPYSFSNGLKIPAIKLNFENENETSVLLNKLIKSLKVRKQKTASAKNECAQQVKLFRKRLSLINDESGLSKSEVQNLKIVLKKQKLLNQNLNAKNADLESNNVSLSMENNRLQEEMQRLQLIVDKKNLQINQNCLEHEKHTQKLTVYNEKFTRELDDRLRKQRHQLENEIHSKDLKLKKMKDIINGDGEHGHANENVILQNISNKPSTKGVATTPSRCRPGEIWLEHNSIKPVALNTVLQPSMRKRKSVDILKYAEDITNPKQTKYCLIAQEAGDAGDIETKLYKGDIVPTCTGGAQVIFNGIECLREESPIKVPSSLNK